MTHTGRNTLSGTQDNRLNHYKSRSYYAGQIIQAGTCTFILHFLGADTRPRFALGSSSIVAVRGWDSAPAALLHPSDYLYLNSEACLFCVEHTHTTVVSHADIDPLAHAYVKRRRLNLSDACIRIRGSDDRVRLQLGIHGGPSLQAWVRELIYMYACMDHGASKEYGRGVASLLSVC